MTSCYKKMHPIEYRLAVVKMYDFFGSMRKISKALNVSTASISRLCKRLHPLKWQSREPKILPAIESAIKIILFDHPCTSASDLRFQIRDRFGIDVSRQLVALTLSKKMKYSWKRTRKRGPLKSSWSCERVEEFKRDFINAYSRGVLSSWDESSFDQRCRPVYGYAPLGKQAIVRPPVLRVSHMHHSLLMGMHMDGSFHQSILTGSVKATHFKDFVLEAPFPPGTVLLLDNHSMHKTMIVREAVASKGYTVLHTPPYSPEYNPIELMFGVIKNSFYKLRTSSSEAFDRGMIHAIDRCVQSKCIADSVSGCFTHVRSIIANGA